MLWFKTVKHISFRLQKLRWLLWVLKEQSKVNPSPEGNPVQTDEEKVKEDLKDFGGRLTVDFNLSLFDFLVLVRRHLDKIEQMKEQVEMGQDPMSDPVTHAISTRLRSVMDEMTKMKRETERLLVVALNRKIPLRNENQMSKVLTEVEKMEAINKDLKRALENSRLEIN